MKKYLGNIVTAYKREKFSPFFNVVKDMQETISGLPTLVIGLENARNEIDGFTILNKHYNDNMLWWTYKKTERKYEFDEDIVSFYDFCTNSYLEKYRYVYIDIPRFRYDRLKKLINYINSPIDKICFQTRDNNFLFIFDTSSNNVFGLSLTLLEYIGVEKGKVIKRVKANRMNRFVYDTSFIDQRLRGVIGANTHYILPLAEVFLSI